MTMEEILGEHGVSYVTEGFDYHTAKGWINLQCPFCSPGSGKFRLGYNLTGRYFSCWLCGSHSLWETLKSLLDISDAEVHKLLKNGLDRGEGPRRPTPKVIGKLQLPKGVGPLLKQHKRYLEERKFDVAALEKLWGLQGIGITGPFKWRIFIPIMYQGKTVSWTTRSLSQNSPCKYLTAKKEQEELFHKDLLFGEDFARHAIIVNEGPFDAMAIGPGAVATMSVNYSKAQLWRMSKYPVRVIAFDNEPDAQRRARRLVDELAVFGGATYNARFITGKDASRANKKEIQELRRRFLCE